MKRATPVRSDRNHGVSSFSLGATLSEESTSVDKTQVQGQPRNAPASEETRKPRTDEDQGMANRCDLLAPVLVSYKWMIGQPSFLFFRSTQVFRGREDERHPTQNHQHRNDERMTLLSSMSVRATARALPSTVRGGASWLATVATGMHNTAGFLDRVLEIAVSRDRGASATKEYRR